MAWDSSTAEGSMRDAADTLPLPKDFRPIRDIVAEDGKKVRVGSLINVCGIVKDFRVPIATRNTGMLNLYEPSTTQCFRSPDRLTADWKATMTLYDISTEHEYTGIELSIFRPKDNIPVVGAGDVVLLYSVKVSLMVRHKR
jgi:hypothetical protein